MTYDALVADISTRTGLPVSTVKKVLMEVPDALLVMDEGDHVRTPLGVFRMTRRKKRNIKLPDGPLAEVGSMLVVRLKSGSRIKATRSQQPARSPSPTLP